MLEQKVQFLLDDGLKFEVKSKNFKISERNLQRLLRNRKILSLFYQIQIKIKVVWGNLFSLNVLNPGHRSSGLVTSLARVGATGKISGPPIAMTNQIPVEILVRNEDQFNPQAPGL